MIPTGADTFKFVMPVLFITVQWLAVGYEVPTLLRDLQYQAAYEETGGTKK